MNYDDIQNRLQSMKRAQLTADRKAVLRERLVARMAQEANSPQPQPRKGLRRPIKPYAYSAAGIVVAAGVVGSVIWGQTTGGLRMSGVSKAGASGTTASTSSSAPTKSSSSSAQNTQSSVLNQSSNLPSTGQQSQVLNSVVQIHLTTGGGGWAIRKDGQLLHTKDSGQSWQFVTPTGLVLDAQHQSITSVIGDFTSQQVASVVSQAPSGTIYTTTTGGTSWHRAKLPVPQGWSITEIQFVDTKTGFAVVQSDSLTKGDIAIYRSDNSGQSWHRIYQGTDGAHVQSDVETHRQGVMVMVNANIGYRLSSTPPGAGPYLLRTADGGQTWSSWHPNLPVPSSLQGTDQTIDVLPQFFGMDGLWTVEYRTSHGTYLEVYHTTDGGQHWRATTPYKMPGTENIDVYFASPTLGWLIEHQSHTLMHTADGGSTWENAGSEPQLTNAVGIQFSDLKHGYLLIRPSGSSSLHLWQTDDGGRDWSAAGH